MSTRTSMFALAAIVTIATGALAPTSASAGPVKGGWDYQIGGHRGFLAYQSGGHGHLENRCRLAMCRQ